MIIENQFINKPFWDALRGEKVNWKKMFYKSIEGANRFLSKNDVAKLD
jgi:hypothetical protein